MDKKKGLLNVTVSIAFKVVILITGLLARKYLIECIGDEMNGLNSFYLSVLSFLAVTELGVGTAITFCMYRPIVEGDNNKVVALYQLFKKLYLIIGGIILACGLVLMPFLPVLIKDSYGTSVNLYLTFGITLAATVLSYLYSAKLSLINAYKNNYISTAITSSGLILQYGLQILVAVVWHSFEGYVLCNVLGVLLQWVAIDVVANKKYRQIIRAQKATLDSETKTEVVKNIKAMFAHKIGRELVNTTDNLIITMFLGAVVLGFYTNYTIIITAMSGLLALFFTPLTSVIGHLFVEESKQETERYFHFFYGFNYLIAIVFFLGYYAVVDNVVTVWLGEGHHVAWTWSIVITLNYFIQFMRQTVLVFQDATGTFYNDRHKPIIEGLLNLVLSVVLVLVLPEDFKVLGVIIATIFTNLAINHTVEPFVLFKYAFQSSGKKYYIRSYLYMAIFVITLVLLHFCKVAMPDNMGLEFLINGSIAVGLGLVVGLCAVLTDRDFRYYLKNIFKKGKK